MIEGIGYGLLLALAFIGFISLVFNIVLHFSRFESTGKYVIHITNIMDKNEIFNLIHSINIRKILYGDPIFNEVLIINSLVDEDKKAFLSEICDGLGGFTIVFSNDIQTIFNNKGV